MHRLFAELLTSCVHISIFLEEKKKTRSSAVSLLTSIGHIHVIAKNYPTQCDTALPGIEPGSQEYTIYMNFTGSLFSVPVHFSTILYVQYPSSKSLNTPWQRHCQDLNLKFKNIL